MNSILIMAVGIVLLFCAIILVVVLKNLGPSKVSKTKVSKNSSSIESKSTSGNIDYSFTDIKDIEIPKKIASLDNRELFKACKVIYDSFKALDYKGTSNTQMSKSEWHSWQVSLLIAFHKSKREFHVGNPEEVFDKSTLEMGPKVLDEAIKKIWKKYNRNVNITLDRDSLSNDIIWTSREVSTMLFYMVKTTY